jgi:hypothetical protein
MSAALSGFEPNILGASCQKNKNAAQIRRAFKSTPQEIPDCFDAADHEIRDVAFEYRF